MVQCRLKVLKKMHFRQKIERGYVYTVVFKDF